MKRRLFILFLMVLLAWQGMFSQTYPVTLIPQAIPPAPIYFSSYADATAINSPLRLQILLNDLSQANREIRLKAYFEGNGIAFESKDLIIGAPSLFVEGGVPLTLSNTELAPYFAFENISGIPPSVYGQVIPEGSYQFCFEVFDTLTGARISQRTCATTYVFQNEPPFLIAPSNQTDISEQNPLNLLFQWTPRHINVSNVQYELSIVEIWDQTMNPQAAFLGSPPVFQITTSNTSYLYGPADPLLLPNKRYAWRVQGKAISGAEEVGLFKNNGYSEIFWFNYTAPCDTPTNTRHEVKGAQQVNILWDDYTTDVPEFTIRYRQKGDNNEWFFAKTSANWTTLWDLRADTEYEYQVNKRCLISESDYSPLQTFTTLAEDDETSLIDCGISPDLDIENMEPLEQLFPGSSFKAGDFPIKVTEVSGSNGRFTGKGYVTFPYFNSIKVAVNFTNVFINNENQLAEGAVITTYDPTWGNILDVDEVIDVAEDIADVFTGGDVTEIPPLDYEIDTEDISITDGQIVIVKPDGTTDTFDYDEGDTHIIKDASGDEWTVKDGNITQTGTGDPSPQITSDNTDGVNSGNPTGTLEDPVVNNITNDAITVTFRTGDDTHFALDLVNNDYEKANYPNINTSSGDSYYPAHKAIVKGENDVFYADIVINDSKINIDSLIIKTVTNKSIKHERLANTNTYKITVTGGDPYRTEEAVITYLDASDNKYKIAANFFIHHLKKHTPTPLQVITVNGGNNISNLETGLNDIFGKAGGIFNVKKDVINITITKDEWDDNDNGVIDYDGSGLLSDYPTELKNIYKAFKKQYPGYDSQQYFVLVLSDEFTVSKPLSGFMPKTRQWGFLFEKHMGQGLEQKDSALKVAAHELGHGVYTLRHPFGDNDANAGQANTWLMDYGDGTELGYPNWATMSDPSLKLMLFQDDKDGEFAADQYLIGNAVAPNKFNQYEVTVNTTSKNESCISFVSPANKLISIPLNAEDITFYHTGALFAFTVLENGKLERYVAAKGRSNNGQELFMGYLKNLGTSDTWTQRVFQDHYSKNLSNKVTVHLGKLKRTDDSCGIDLYKKEGYPNTVDKGEKQWNSGGRKENLLKTNQIGSLTPYMSNVNSPEACDLCTDGNNFYKEYSYLIKSEEDAQALTGIAKLVCSEGDDKIDYDILVAQISKDFSDKLDRIFWGSDKALFIKARDAFWYHDGALSLYLKALQRVNKNIKAYNEKLGSNASKEEFYSALYYLNDKFISDLTYEEKEKLLEIIFQHNIFIGDDLFVSGKSDVSLIKKIVNNVDNTNLDQFIDKIIGNKERYKPSSQSGLSQKREVLFEIVNALEFDKLKARNINIKIEALSKMLDGNILTFFGTNYQDVITKLMKSVTNEEAATFLSSLEDPKKSFDEDPLVFHLKERLTNFFTNSDSYTSFFKEINRLAAERAIESPNTYGIKAEINWKVENRDYVLLSFVRDKNDYEYLYDEETHKVKLLTCKNGGKDCSSKINLLEKSGSPFDMVMVYFYDNASPFSPVTNKHLYTESGLEAKGHIIPVIFLEHMYDDTGDQRIKNLAWNTFNVVITVATLGEGAAAISAVRIAANSGTKILFRTLYRQSYSLIDLSITVGGAAYQFGTGDKLPKTFQYVGYFLAAKTTFDLLNGGLKGLAVVDNATAAQKQKYLDDLQILNSKGKKITLDEFDDLIVKSKQLLNKNEHLKSEYRRVLLEIKLGVSASKTSILSKLDGLADPKLIKLKDWINKLGDNDLSLLQKLDDLGDDILKIGKDFDFGDASVISKFIKDPNLVDAWGVLKAFPEIRVVKGNIEILSKVSKRFEYDNKSSFEGLQLLFNGSAASKQKLINGLKKADEIFDPSLPVKFSGVKKGDIKITRTIDGKGDEVARFVDNKLVKKKFLEDGTPKGKYEGDDILKKGDEVGFRKKSNGPAKLVEGNNIFRGSAAEYSLAKKRLKEYMDGEIYKIKNSGLPKSEQDELMRQLNKKNKAYLEGNIGNLKFDNLTIRKSGDTFEGEDIFTAYKVDKNGGINTAESWIRNADTEYVMLSEIARDLGAKKGKIYPNIKGEFKIVSELPYCLSCQGVIKNFSTMFPNVKIVLIDNLKY
ncbi:deaminase domain-containing protein [Aquimarina sp. 2201CG1-2-11]|uniref:deaminase domain-containing protein n=1 Tax=Aquimarina discodermiae TaxID=3231043 RepID=UPI0034619350